jgi:hypothetical protein
VKGTDLIRHYARMEPEEQDPALLVGWHVVEAGRRQAWPFVNLADPVSGREVRLYVDTTFSVAPGWLTVEQHGDAALLALDSLSGSTVTTAESVGGALALHLGHVALRIQRDGNHLTTGSPWWIGATAR